MKEIAIIGAGIAGLTAAKRLQHQAEIQIFEKSWRPGGRMTSRNNRYNFDHGAQYFCVKTEAFHQFLAPFIEQGTIQRWDARFAELDRDRVIATRQWNADFPHYVAVSGMTDFSRVLAQNLNIHYQTLVTQIVRRGNRWELITNGTLLGNFDWVILALPAPQAAALMPDCFSHLQHIRKITMQACYSLMVGFQMPLHLDFDAALIRNMDISWISVNSSKPARPREFTLVVHSTNSWADDNFNLSGEAITQHLIAEVEGVIHRDLSSADHVDLHRWLYANIGRQQGPSTLVDYQHQLAAIGDWCISGRVESAFTSGFELSINPAHANEPN